MLKIILDYRSKICLSSYTWSLCLKSSIMSLFIVILLKSKIHVNGMSHCRGYSIGLNLCDSQLLHQRCKIIQLFLKIGVSAYLMYLALWIKDGAKLLRKWNHGCNHIYCYSLCFIYQCPITCINNHVSLRGF